MNNERAYNAAYDVIANVSNPASFSYMENFPGFDRLGLDPDNTADALVADAIIYALQAGESYATNGMDSDKAGRLVAMIRYGIVRTSDIDAALWRYRNPSEPGI